MLHAVITVTHRISQKFTSWNYTLQFSMLFEDKLLINTYGKAPNCRIVAPFLMKTGKACISDRLRKNEFSLLLAYGNAMLAEK